MRHLKTQEVGTQRIIRALKQVMLPGFNTGVFVAEQGCVVETHGHEQVEEVYLISGRLRMGESVLEAGDIHRIEIGESCDLEALEDCRFLLMNY